ncbi:MAG TPA: hypothetical protein VGM76_16890 [Lacipirellulaceae bacterium]
MGSIGGSAFRADCGKMGWEAYMTLNLDIPSATAAILRERAESAGEDVETFVLRAIREKLADADLPATSSVNGSDWTARLHKCIDLHPASRHVVDDGRESIYASRGE